MLTLNDGRKELYQWDTGRMATVDIECDVVHFSNLKYGESLAVEVKAGEVSIPNKLLMNGEPIYCWAFVKDEGGAYTKKEQALNVIKRAKPSDYVYTETEVITIKTAVENALQEAKESGEFKGEKGDKGERGERGLQGVQGERGADGAKGDKGDRGEQGIQGIQGAKGDKGDIGEPGAKGDKGDAFTYEDFTPEQLASLKGEKGDTGAAGKNGEDGYTPVKGVDYFDGVNGKDGKDGADGYTPVRGTDYWTSADKAEIKSYVDEAILGGAW